MLKLITTVSRWLAKNALLFAVILTILMSTAWLSSSWNDNKNDKSKIVQMALRVDQKSEQLEQLKEQVVVQGKEFADIEKAKRILNFRRGEMFDAKRNLDQVKSQCGIVHSLCAPWLLDEIIAAEAHHSQAVARYSIALKKWQLLLKSTTIDETLAKSIDELNHDIVSLTEDIKDTQDRIDKSKLQWFISLANGQAATAILIVLAIMLTPIIVKIFLYYIVAPVASRLPPVILPSKASGEFSHGKPTVSIDISIEPGQELVTRQNALQSFSTNSRKSTRWLLNYKLPLSSIAAGMYGLTSIRADGSSVEQATVSIENDLFSKIVTLDIPEGSALVLKPHSLVGLVKSWDSEIKITRHWRLLSLHSWLTLQFRYLVFHGPCQIIVKGCRGVRVEQPTSDNARLINQTATLGFSANLDYSNQRCETFYPYITGNEGLFKDRFSKGSGFYIYEETVDPKRGGGTSGHTLERLAHAVLSAFGI